MPGSDEGVTLRLFKADEERTGRIWFMRVASLAAIFAALAAIGFFLRRGDLLIVIFLLLTVQLLAVLFSWTWTGSLITSLEWAQRYIQGAEGEHRHEWYSFKSQRVRIFLDAMQRPWFPVNEIAFILDLKVEKDTFRHYGPHEYGAPESASERCLSESGLRRLIKYSPHPDAGALGIWLEREVLRMLGNRNERQPEAAESRSADRIDEAGPGA